MLWGSEGALRGEQAQTPRKKSGRPVLAAPGAGCIGKGAVPETPFSSAACSDAWGWGAAQSPVEKTSGEGREVAADIGNGKVPKVVQWVPWGPGELPSRRNSCSIQAPAGCSWSWRWQVVEMRWEFI